MAKEKILIFDLPYPPSINHYWRQVGNRTLISRQGRIYRERARDFLTAYRLDNPFEILKGPLILTAEFYPPDNRRRDLDNLAKALLDSLQHGGVYADDFQIWRLVLIRCGPILGDGKVMVTIRESEG
jgi:Holliday junction resolvase RusA-like endonuclease